MKKQMDLLEIRNYEIYEELAGAAVCDINEDKVLIIKDIVMLEQVEEITYLLSNIRPKLMQRMENNKNIDNVGESLPLSKFLWDIYVIGLHDLSNGDNEFNSFDVAKVQRNRFAARKIIIEYKSESELKKQFNQLVLPERALDQLLEEYKNHEVQEDFTDIVELLESVDKLVSQEVEGD